MKTIKKLLGIALALGCLFQLSAQDSIRYLTVNQVCLQAIEKNINVRNAQLEYQKSGYQTKEVRSKLYPQIDGYSNFNYYYNIPKMLMPGEMFGTTGEVAMEIGTKFNWTSGLNGSISLVNLTNYTAIKIAKRAQAMSELSIQQKKEEVIYDVTQLYYLCKTTESEIAHLQGNMENTSQLLSILTLQKENGVARGIDYSKVLVNKNNLQTQIDNLKQLQNQQLNMLKYIIGEPLTSAVVLSDNMVYVAENKSGNSPEVDKLTDIMLLDKQIELSALNKRMNTTGYLPVLSGVGTFYYEGQRNEIDYFKPGGDKFFKVGYVGLSLTMPIFDGFERHAKSQQYKIEMLQLKNSRQNSLEQNSKAYLDAKAQYNNGLMAMQRQEENIKIAQEDYNVTLQGYRQQVVPLSDLLLSKNALTEAQLSYENALLQLKNAELEVKKLNGDLLKF